MPTVFLSYSHDSEHHKKLIFGLSRDIKQRGIQVFIDQDRQNDEEDWPLWCEKKIMHSDYIVVVCTSNYHRRVYDESYVRSGVKFEGFCIRQKLYENGMYNQNIVPIIMNDHDECFIPLFLKGYSFFVMNNSSSVKSFYRKISLSRAEKPPLGLISKTIEDLEILDAVKHLLPSRVYEEGAEVILFDMLRKKGYRI